MDLPSSPTRQFSLTIIVQVHRERLVRLRAVLEDIRLETIELMEGGPGKASMPFDAMTTIHYARWALIDRHRAYMSGPQLVFSTNYDGPIGDNECDESAARKQHIAELIEHGHEALHEIYRCCVGYEPESHDPKTIKSHLEQYLTHPDHLYPSATFYIGSPGRSRDQILEEAELRRRVDLLIDEKQQARDWPPADPLAIRRDIRDALGEEIPPFPPQPSIFEGPLWYAKLLGLLLLILVEFAVLANVQYLLWQIAPQVANWHVTVASAATVIVAAIPIYHYVKWILPEPGRLLRSVFVGFLLAVGVFAALLVSFEGLRGLIWKVHLGVAVAAFLALSPWKTYRWSVPLMALLAVAALLMASPGLREPGWSVWCYCFAILAAATAIPLAIALYLQQRALAHLRHLEATDPPFEPYNTLTEFSHAAYSATDENRFFQNQLSNITVLKPGAFRAKLLEGVFYALQLLAPTVYNKGKLGDIPTIHFARWVMIDHGRRVLFFSNFDSSWQSYLGDFIDKASSGLTAVWSNTVGYPRTRDLLYAGSEDADTFKAWARHCQIRTQVWYSAYPGLSIRNVNDNTVIRRGLAQSNTVGEQEWLDALHGRIS